MSQPKVIFSIGLFVYLTVKLSFTGIPMFYRDLPEEVIDSLVYMSKAAQIDHCLDLKCPALQDILEQASSPTEDPIIYRHRREFLGAGTAQFQFFHALSINALHRLGLDWVSSLNLVNIFGVLIIALGLAVFLQSLFGTEASGIALFFLSIAYLPAYGLNNVVPGNISLGIALLTWGLIIRRSPKAEIWLPILIILMCGFHVLGKAWLAVTLVLLIGGFNWPPKQPEIKAILSALIAFLAIILFPLFMNSPNFQGSYLIKPEQLSYVVAVKENIHEAIFITGRTSLTIGGIGLGLAISLAGLLHLPSHRRRHALAIFVSLTGLCFVSLFYVLPHYPANLFYRTLAPLWVLLVGAIAYTAYKGFPKIWKSRKAFFSEKKELSHSENFLSAQGWFLFSGAVATLVATGAGFLIILETYVMVRDIKFRAMHHDYNINMGQSELILQGNNQCGTVIYNSDIGLYFYLMQGATKCGALYLPAILNTPDEIMLKDRQHDITHAVFQNPIRAHKSRIPVSSSNGIVLRLSSQTPDGKLKALIETGDKKSTLTIFDGGNLETLITLAPFQRNWVDLASVISEEPKEITLKLANPMDGIFVSGVRVFPTSQRVPPNLKWPWDQGISVHYYDFEEQKEDRDVNVDFNLGELIGLKNFHYEILDDTGVTVLSKVYSQQ